MKFTYSCLFHSEHCSSIFLRVKIWSAHLRPLRNPACSSRRTSSTALVIRWIMTLQKILLGTDKRVTPCQLLQSLRDPFFGILIITPVLQSDGVPSCSPTWTKGIGGIPPVYPTRKDWTPIWWGVYNARPTELSSLWVQPETCMSASGGRQQEREKWIHHQTWMRKWVLKK